MKNYCQQTLHNGSFGSYKRVNTKTKFKKAVCRISLLEMTTMESMYLGIFGSMSTQDIKLYGLKICSQLVMVYNEDHRYPIKRKPIPNTTSN